MPAKSSGPSAIRTVAAGDALLFPSITHRVISQFARLPRSAPPEELAALAARGMEVLRLIARGLSNAEIRERLVISDTAVKTHVTHIFQKLNLCDRVQAVVLAYGPALMDSELGPERSQ